MPSPDARTRAARRALACVPLATLGALGCGAPRASAVRDGGASDGAEPAETPREQALSGQLLTRYRGRFTGDESDHDLYETVDLALQDPAGRYAGALLARANYDMDGLDSGTDDFFSLQDTYEHRFEPQLFHAYLDLERGAFSRLRLGRQPLYDTPLVVVFDGFLAELAPRGTQRARLAAYGGVGEHLYESDSDGDLVLGSFGSLVPWSGAELRGDWMHLEDARLGVDHEDDLFGLSLSQDVLSASSATRLDARFSSLEGDGRDLRLGASHVDSDAHWSLQGTLYTLLQTQKSLAAPLDPFSSSLFELFPFAQLGLSASKDWEHLALLAGTDLRRVTDEDDEGQYNRDFERYFLTGTLPDALPVTLSLTGETWRASDDEYETWGAAVARELDERWELTLGSYYSLYKYDLSTGDERDDVRSTYVELRFRPERLRRWRLRYELEQNDIDDYHQVRLEYAWGF